MKPKTYQYAKDFHPHYYVLGENECFWCRLFEDYEELRRVGTKLVEAFERMVKR